MIENNVRKGKNAGSQPFLFSPQGFQKASVLVLVKAVRVNLILQGFLNLKVTQVLIG